MTTQDEGQKPSQSALARIEGLAALSVVVGMRGCLAALEALRHIEDVWQRHVMFTGLVVTYSRSFEEVVDDDESNRLVRKFKTKGIIGFDKVLHNRLLNLRDECFAHAGHQVNDFELSFIRVESGVTLKMDDGTTRDIRMIVDRGSQARGSFCIGLSDSDDEERLKSHFNAILEASANALALRTIDHQTEIKRKIQEEGAHDMGKVVFRREIEGGTTIESGEETLLMEIKPEDSQFSLARSTSDLPLKFAAAFYSLAPEPQGELSLCEEVRAIDVEQPLSD